MRGDSAIPTQIPPLIHHSTKDISTRSPNHTDDHSVYIVTKHMGLAWLAEGFWLGYPSLGIYARHLRFVI